MRYMAIVSALAGTPLLLGCAADRSVVQPASAAVIDSAVIALVEGSSGRLEPNLDTVALRRLLDALPIEARPLVRAAFEEHGGRIYEVAGIEGIPNASALLEAVTAPQREARKTRVAGASRSVDVWVEPVTLALVDQSGETGSDIVIQRRVAPEAHDVVILTPASAHPRWATEAFRALATLRRRDGVVPTQDRTVYMKIPAARSPTLTGPRSWTEYVRAKLVELRASPTTHVAGLGMAKVLEIQSLGR